jgi:hypothetical protein
VFDTAHVTESLQGLEGEHLFPGDVLACHEAKEVDQEEGISDDGATETTGFDRGFPLQVIHNALHQHPDVFISHVRPPEEFVP